MVEQQSAQDAPAGSAPAPAVTAKRSTRGGLRTFDSLRNNRNYRFLFAGNISANGAQWLQIFTVGWLVLSISEGSALHSVAVAGIRSLPVLALGPWAGVLADRIDRRNDRHHHPRGPGCLGRGVRRTHRWRLGAGLACLLLHAAVGSGPRHSTAGPPRPRSQHGSQVGFGQRPGAKRYGRQHHEVAGSASGRAPHQHSRLQVELLF